MRKYCCAKAFKPVRSSVFLQIDMLEPMDICEHVIRWERGAWACWHMRGGWDDTLSLTQALRTTYAG